MISHNVPIEIEGLVFLASPIVLQSSNIDLILRNGLVENAHNALIDCAAKTVQLTTFFLPNNKLLHQINPNAEAQIYALNALNTSPLEGIENVPVICTTSKMSFQRTPRNTPARAVEFVIDLKPGTTPIAKRPYKMPPHELLELKEEIDKALHKGFIHPSSSAWGAPSLFVQEEGWNQSIGSGLSAY